MDTSAWVDHLRRANRRLTALLDRGQVLAHPFVIGELTLGNLTNRQTVLEFLSYLPSTPLAEHAEVVEFINLHRLPGTGIGWVDAHLLASSLLAGAALWTLDGPLQNQARRLGVAADP